MNRLWAGRALEMATVAVMLLSAWFALQGLMGVGWKHCWWDLQVYVRAAADVASDRDPYRADVAYLFVYHPHVLRVFCLISEYINLQWGMVAAIFGAAAVFCKAFLAFEDFGFDGQLSAGGMRPSWRWAMGSVLVFGSVGWGALASGNVSLLIHFLLLACALNAIRRPGAVAYRRWYAVGLVLAVLCKPYFLSYLLLLWPMMGWRRALVHGLLIVSTAALLWASGAWLQPQLYGRFMSALASQTLGRSDFGLGLVALLHKRIGIGPAAMLHMGAVLGFGAWLAWSHRRAGAWRWNAATVSLLVMVIILLNPRAKEYDIWAAVLFGLAYLRQVSARQFFLVIVLGVVAASLPSIARLADAWHGPHLADILRVNNYAQTLGVLVVMAVVALAARFGGFHLHGRTPTPA